MSNFKIPIKRAMKSFVRILLVTLLVSVITMTVVGLCFAIYIEKNIEKEVDEELFNSVGSESSTKLYYYDFENRENRIGEAVLISDEELYGGYRCEYVS